MALDEDRAVYVSSRKLEDDDGNPPMWHTDEDCYNVRQMEYGVSELSVAEAREECVRQAGCCRGSVISTLEDVQP